MFPNIRQNDLNWKTHNNHKYLLTSTTKEKKINVGSLQNFIELIETDIFKRENYRKIKK